MNGEKRIAGAVPRYFAYASNLRNRRSRCKCHSRLMASRRVACRSTYRRVHDCKIASNFDPTPKVSSALILLRKSGIWGASFASNRDPTQEVDSHEQSTRCFSLGRGRNWTRVHKLGPGDDFYSTISVQQVVNVAPLHVWILRTVPRMSGNPIISTPRLDARLSRSSG
jgi:hypothetical protein